MGHVLGTVFAPSQQQIRAAFDACHKKVVWTYETIVATDFLPRFSAEETLNRVAPGALHAYQRSTEPNSALPDPKRVNTFFYSCNPEHITIPHEFAVAAFRLGHTLVRDKLCAARSGIRRRRQPADGSAPPDLRAGGRAGDDRARRRQSAAAR